MAQFKVGDRVRVRENDNALADYMNQWKKKRTILEVTMVDGRDYIYVRPWGSSEDDVGGWFNFRFEKVKTPSIPMKRVKL